METSYEISLNMKTLKGIETYGSFHLGHDLLDDVNMCARCINNVEIIEIVRREKYTLKRGFLWF